MPWDHSATQTSLDASGVFVPDSLFTHLFIAGGDPVIPTFVNTNGHAFDLDERDGIAQNSTGLESTLTHEALHALGFTSRGDLELSDLPADFLLLADLFRFSETAGTISASEVRTSPRQLRPDLGANLAVALNTFSALHAMSRGSRTGGDAFQPEHWRQFLLPPQITPIGIMDPDASLAAGAEAPVPGVPQSRLYLTIADIRAMDIFGWNIDDFPFADDVPGAPSMFSPANAASGVALEPVLSWLRGGDTDNTQVSVFETDDLAPASLVFQASDLGIQESVVVPPGTLEAGHTYYWFVTAENLLGITFSELLSFSTAGGPCNAADFAEPYGVLDFSDVLAFKTAFGTMDPSADLAVPFGVFDFSDTFAFLTAFGEGCP